MLKNKAPPGGGGKDSKMNKLAFVCATRDGLYLCDKHTIVCLKKYSIIFDASRAVRSACDAISAGDFIPQLVTDVTLTDVLFVINVNEHFIDYINKHMIKNGLPLILGIDVTPKKSKYKRIRYSTPVDQTNKYFSL